MFYHNEKKQIADPDSYFLKFFLLTFNVSFENLVVSENITSPQCLVFFLIFHPCLKMFDIY